MNQSISEMLEGLRKAMQAERTGHEFYKMAARNTEDPLATKVFEQLAEEEAEHFEFLRKHYASLQAHGTLVEGLTLETKNTHSAESPIFSDNLKRRIKQAHFEMSALAVAAQLELNGINHYREQAERASLPELKRFYEGLVKWETAHYDSMIKQQQELQAAYWDEAGFSPF